MNGVEKAAEACIEILKNRESYKLDYETGKATLSEDARLLFNERNLAYSAKANAWNSKRSNTTKYKPKGMVEMRMDAELHQSKLYYRMVYLSHCKQQFGLDEKDVEGNDAITHYFNSGLSPLDAAVKSCTKIETIKP